MIMWVHRQTGRDRYYIALAEAVSFEQFMSMAKVTSGSYAGRMVLRMYDSIFRASTELKHDFETFYRVEYTDFASYAKRRLALRTSEAKQLASAYEDSAVIFEFEPRHYFLREEFGSAMLETLLMVGGAQ